jgi:hypothetical protein
MFGTWLAYSRYRAPIAAPVMWIFSFHWAQQTGARPNSMSRVVAPVTLKKDNIDREREKCLVIPSMTITIKI